MSAPVLAVGDGALGFWGAPREGCSRGCGSSAAGSTRSPTCSGRCPGPRTRGPGSRAAGLAMACKLIQAVQDRWRAVNAPHIVALVRAGATFEAGKLVERPNQQPQPKAA